MVVRNEGGRADRVVGCHWDVAAERVAGVDYQVRWRGGRVAELSPAGTNCSHYWWRRQ